MKQALIALGIIACMLVATIPPLQFTEHAQAEDLPTFESQSSDWWNLNWSYSKKITIDHSQVAGNLTNFPVCINITDSGLASKAQTDGDDIIFVSADNTTQYNHEIELYNSSTGQLVAWVNITDLSSSSDTTMYLYYGNTICSNQENSEDVWDSNYVSVWHNSNVNDSKNNYDGINNGVSFAGEFIGNASLYDETNTEYINYGCISELHGVDKFTISIWFKAESLGSYGVLFGERYNEDNRLWLGTHSSANRLLFAMGSGADCYGYANDMIYTNNIYHTNVVYDGKQSNNANKLKIFLDNEQISLTFGSTVIPSSTQTNAIDFHSGHGLTNDYYDGMLDELRISNIARSNDWIYTSYNSQSNATDGGFYTIGDEQTQGNQFTAWEYNRSIAFNSSQIPSNLTNFPVCINITDTHLKNNTQADGEDLLFTADNVTKLNHEIELYNSTSGQLVAWVNVTELSGSSDTTIWMYYGNATCNNQENVVGTWSNNFERVWHMADLTESTGNGANLGNNGASLVSSHLGKGYDFEQDEVDYMTTSTTGDFGTDFSFFVYTTVESVARWRALISNMPDSNNDDFKIAIYDTSDWRIFIDDGSNPVFADGGTPSTGTKVFYGLLDETGNTGYLYLNNDLLGSDTDASFSSWNPATNLYIGTQPNLAGNTGNKNYHWDGVIDEFRISSVQRSSGWRTTVYNNLVNATDGGFFALEPTGLSNTAPNTPTSPECQNHTWSDTDHLTDHTPYFDWVFSDSDTNDTQHGFQIQVGNDTDWGTIEMLNYQENTSNNFTTYNGSPLQDGDTYYWRVRVKDNDSAWSDYTANQQFRMNSVPSIPTLNSPANNAHNMSYTTNSINLSWYEATDAESDSPNYWWQYSRADDFSLMSTEADGDEGWSTGPTWEWIPNQGELIERTDYYWRVKSWDGLEFSGWSNVRTFETDEKIDLTDLSISDNATGVSINITEWSINITHDEATLFKWWINTTPDIGNASGFNADDGIKTCQLSGLQYNTTYEVQVVVIGSSRNETYTFTTEEDPGDNIHVTLSPQAEASIEVNRSAWEPNIGITGDIKTDPVWGLLDNNGSITVDVTVNVSNTLNWTAAPTAAHNQFQMQIHNSSWYTIDNTHQTFVENLAYNEDQTFGLQLFMPTSSETNTNQTATITFVATAD